MSLETKCIAAALRSRSAWEKFSRHLSTEEFVPYNACLFELISDYYDKDPKATSADAGIIDERLRLTFKNNDKTYELYKQHLHEALGTDVSVDNVVSLILDLSREELGRKIGMSLINGQNKDKVPELMDKYLAASTDADSLDEEDKDREYSNVSVVDIVASTMDKSQLIKLYPAALNDALDGGCLAGHHVVIFARPETGKTASCVSLIAGFCEQGLDGIYFGNEDPIKQIIQRTMCAMCRADKSAIESNPEKAQAVLEKRGWKHVRFVPLIPGTPREIEKYVAQHNPRWIIIDQLRNLIVPGAGNKVEQLEEAAKLARRMAQKYNLLAISITQAGDSATNKLVLDQGDVDYSNTGIPAQADVMIGMGVNVEYEQAGLRMLSLPKNKVSGRHVHFPVRILPHQSRIENV